MRRCDCVSVGEAGLLVAISAQFQSILAEKSIATRPELHRVACVS
jgi:hypothetical protein